MTMPGDTMRRYADAADEPLWRFRALVERVVDADTCEVHLDLGFLTYRRLTVRLMTADGDVLRRMDADEMSDPFGVEATQAVESMMPVGSRVTVRTEWLDRPRPLPDGGFGRWAAAIRLRDGVDLGSWLLDRGYAHLDE